MEGGKATGAIFIDLSKAFDTISHSVLLEKLSRYGIQDNELHWFTDYLFLRSQIVQNKGVLSEPNRGSFQRGFPKEIFSAVIFSNLF